MKFTDEFMKKSLDRFCENYKYPVFASIYCRSGFFSRYNAKTGFLAVTDDDKLLVVEYSALGISENEYIFSPQDLKSFKIKKLALMPAYSVKAVFKINRKTIKLDVAVSKKVSCSNFSEQEENTDNFIQTLESWYNYIKE